MEKNQKHQYFFRKQCQLRSNHNVQLKSVTKFEHAYIEPLRDIIDESR